MKLDADTHSGIKGVIIVSLFSLAAGCADLGEQANNDLVDYTGTVIQEPTQSFLIESDAAFDANLKTFYPLNLPDVFKQDGLRIRFSGNIEIDPTALYRYPPIRLSRIASIGQSDGSP